MHSSNVVPVPPKMSRALPIVRSTLPLLRSRTRSRSSMVLAPPAYVTGMLHHCESFSTSSVSTPCCRPSLSAAWTRNSEQHGSSMAILSFVISNSVIVCHLFMATNQVSSLRRQLRSITSLDVLLSRAERTASSRSREK